jgi:hypothetical protein
MTSVLPPLWVYKNNALQLGDWEDFFAGPQPDEWGGSTTIFSNESLDILWNRMAPGDLVLAWQTDRRVAVGLCRVVDLDDKVVPGERFMILERVGASFEPHVRLLDMRKANPTSALAHVRAFAQGHMGSLYETTPKEARVLLRACGVRVP